MLQNYKSSPRQAGACRTSKPCISLRSARNEKWCNCLNRTGNLKRACFPRKDERTITFLGERQTFKMRTITLTSDKCVELF